MSMSSTTPSGDDAPTVSDARPVRTAASIAEGERFGPYRIVDELGRGGMGVVYRAVDERTGEECALKLLPPELARDESYVERFKREVRATERLNHRALMRIIDEGEEDGTLYFASELVAGGSLRRLLDRQRVIPAPICLLLMDELFDGLAAAHAAGVVHRDLKPENLLLTTSGALKIADFGIAKASDDDTLTKSGALIGTPRYMSPEQARARTVTAASDMFAVGTILYELLAGANPFAQGSTAATLVRVIAASVAPVFDVVPTITPTLERLLEKLHAEDPAQRPSAQEARTFLTPLILEAGVRHGGNLRVFLDDPVAVTAKVARAEADAERARAKELEKSGNREAAAFAIWRASLWANDDETARARDQREVARLGFKFDAPPSPRLAKLEQAIRVQPEWHAPLLRAAEQARIDGDLFRAISYTKRYLRLMPHDAHVRRHLAQLTGIDAPTAPAEFLGSEATVAAKHRRVTPVAAAAAPADDDDGNVVAAVPAPFASPFAPPAPMELQLATPAPLGKRSGDDAVDGADASALTEDGAGGDVARVHVVPFGPLGGDAAAAPNVNGEHASAAAAAAAASAGLVDMEAFRKRLQNTPAWLFFVVVAIAAISVWSLSAAIVAGAVAWGAAVVIAKLGVARKESASLAPAPTAAASSAASSPADADGALRAATGALRELARGVVGKDSLKVRALLERAASSAVLDDRESALRDVEAAIALLGPGHRAVDALADVLNELRAGRPAG